MNKKHKKHISFALAFVFIFQTLFSSLHINPVGDQSKSFTVQIQSSLAIAATASPNEGRVDIVQERGGDVSAKFVRMCEADWGDMWKSVLVGALSGAATAGGGGIASAVTEGAKLIVQILITALIMALTQAIMGALEAAIMGEDVGKAFVMGLITGAISGAAQGALNGIFDKFDDVAKKAADVAKAAGTTVKTISKVGRQVMKTGISMLIDAGVGVAVAAVQYAFLEGDEKDKASKKSMLFSGFIGGLASGAAKGIADSIGSALASGAAEKGATAASAAAKKAIDTTAKRLSVVLGMAVGAVLGGAAQGYLSAKQGGSFGLGFAVGGVSGAMLGMASANSGLVRKTGKIEDVKAARESIEKAQAELPDGVSGNLSESQIETLADNKIKAQKAAKYRNADDMQDAITAVNTSNDQVFQGQSAEFRNHVLQSSGMGNFLSSNPTAVAEIALDNRKSFSEVMRTDKNNNNILNLVASEVSAAAGSATNDIIHMRYERRRLQQRMALRWDANDAKIQGDIEHNMRVDESYGAVISDAMAQSHKKEQIVKAIASTAVTSATYGLVKGVALGAQQVALKRRKALNVERPDYQQIGNDAQEQGASHFEEISSDDSGFEAGTNRRIAKDTKSEALRAIASSPLSEAEFVESMEYVYSNYKNVDQQDFERTYSDYKRNVASRDDKLALQQAEVVRTKLDRPSRRAYTGNLQHTDNQIIEEQSQESFRQVTVDPYSQAGAEFRVDGVTKNEAIRALADSAKTEADVQEGMQEIYRTYKGVDQRDFKQAYSAYDNKNYRLSKTAQLQVYGRTRAEYEKSRAIHNPASVVMGETLTGIARETSIAVVGAGASAIANQRMMGGYNNSGNISDLRESYINGDISRDDYLRGKRDYEHQQQKQQQIASNVSASVGKIAEGVTETAIQLPQNIVAKVRANRLRDLKIDSLENTLSNLNEDLSDLKAQTWSQGRGRGGFVETEELKAKRLAIETKISEAEEEIDRFNADVSYDGSSWTKEQVNMKFGDVYDNLYTSDPELAEAQRVMDKQIEEESNLEIDNANDAARTRMGLSAEDAVVLNTSEQEALSEKLEQIEATALEGFEEKAATYLAGKKQELDANLGELGRVNQQIDDLQEKMNNATNQEDYNRWSSEQDSLKGSREILQNAVSMSRSEYQASSFRTESAIGNHTRISAYQAENRHISGVNERFTQVQDIYDDFTSQIDAEKKAETPNILTIRILETQRDNKIKQIFTDVSSDLRGDMLMEAIGTKVSELEPKLSSPTIDKFKVQFGEKTVFYTGDEMEAHGFRAAAQRNKSYVGELRSGEVQDLGQRGGVFRNFIKTMVAPVWNPGYLGSQASSWTSFAVDEAFYDEDNLSAVDKNKAYKESLSRMAGSAAQSTVYNGLMFGTVAKGSALAGMYVADSDRRQYKKDIYDPVMERINSRRYNNDALDNSIEFSDTELGELNVYLANKQELLSGDIGRERQGELEGLIHEFEQTAGESGILDSFGPYMSDLSSADAQALQGYLRDKAMLKDAAPDSEDRHDISLAIARFENNEDNKPLLKRYNSHSNQLMLASSLVDASLKYQNAPESPAMALFSDTPAIGPSLSSRRDAIVEMAEKTAETKTLEFLYASTDYDTPEKLEVAMNDPRTGMQQYYNETYAENRGKEIRSGLVQELRHHFTAEKLDTYFESGELNKDDFLQKTPAGKTIRENPIYMRIYGGISATGPELIAQGERAMRVQITSGVSSQLEGRTNPMAGFASVVGRDILHDTFKEAPRLLSAKISNDVYTGYRDPGDEYTNNNEMQMLNAAVVAPFAHGLAANINSRIQRRFGSDGVFKKSIDEDVISEYGSAKDSQATADTSANTAYQPQGFYGAGLMSNVVMGVNSIMGGAPGAVVAEANKKIVRQRLDYGRLEGNLHDQESFDTFSKSGTAYKEMLKNENDSSFVQNIYINEANKQWQGTAAALPIAAKAMGVSNEGLVDRVASNHTLSGATIYFDADKLEELRKSETMQKNFALNNLDLKTMSASQVEEALRGSMSHIGSKLVDRGFATRDFTAYQKRHLVREVLGVESESEVDTMVADWDNTKSRVTKNLASRYGNDGQMTEDLGFGLTYHQVFDKGLEWRYESGYFSGQAPDIFVDQVGDVDGYNSRSIKETDYEDNKRVHEAYFHLYEDEYGIAPDISKGIGGENVMTEINAKTGLGSAGLPAYGNVEQGTFDSAGNVVAEKAVRPMDNSRQNEGIGDTDVYKSNSSSLVDIDSYKIE